MMEAACLLFLNFVLGVIALVFGLAGLVRGEIRLTPSRTLHGEPARVAGMVCVIGAVVFWLFSACMWSRIDR